MGACWAHHEHAAEVGARLDGWDRVRLGVGNCGGRARWACCAALVGAHRRVGAGGIPSARWEPRSLCRRSVPKPTEQRRGRGRGEEAGAGGAGAGAVRPHVLPPPVCFTPPSPHLPSPRLRRRARSVLFRSAAPGAAAAARAQPRARLSPVGTAPPAAAGPPAAGRCRSAGGDPRLP